jgi:hypothetical protein
MRLRCDKVLSEMDLDSDVKNAFERLISLLEQSPNEYYRNTVGNDSNAEYSVKLVKRCSDLQYRINHLVEDGLFFPDEYVWRLFFDAIEVQGDFISSDGFFIFKYDSEQQYEFLRIVKSAKLSMNKLLHEQTQEKRQSYKRELSQARYKKNNAKNKQETWVLKLCFCILIAFGYCMWLLPLVYSKYSHSAEFDGFRINTTLTVFAVSLALANTIRKP